MASTLFYRASTLVSSTTMPRHLLIVGAFCVLILGFPNLCPTFFPSSYVKKGCALSFPFVPLLRSKFSTRSSDNTLDAVEMEGNINTLTSIVVYVTVPNREADDIITSSLIQEKAALLSFVSLMDSRDKEADMRLSHKGSKPVLINDNGNMCFLFEMHGKDNGKCMTLNTADMLLHPPPILSVVDTDFNVLESSAHISPPISRYVLKKRLGNGGFGEAWLSSFLNCTREEHSVDLMHHKREILRRRFCLDPQSGHSQSSLFNHGCYTDDYFVIKRIMVEKGHAVYLSGLREKHFGEVLLNASLYHNEGNKHIARYVESLDCEEQGIWLLFQHEGISFSKILYATEMKDRSTKSVKILEQSSYWRWLKTTTEGEEEMKQIILQLLKALKFCHDLDITHRDIKPDNVILCFEAEANGKCLKQKSGHNQRVIDFGSAIDEFSIKHLYGSTGPSSYEQTYDYTPPEALLNSSWFHEPKSSRMKYDMWSVGVVMLEMIIGSPHVFQLSHRAYALLALQFKNLNEDEMKLLYQIGSFMELCIVIPEDIDILQNWKADKMGKFPTSRKCSEEVFSNQIKSRDPLKIGFPNVWALQLVRQLLRWDPEERLSVSEALQHPYFQLPH